ncbi:MAG: right-handed parallel beta-helix repeat-containing protein, partial [Lentisphaerae bacterium]|nr:right-handed parallel beta-helix repeat-containing protein [Lentisphaerota bacterium]
MKMPFLFLALSVAASAATYYVDSHGGNDDADGLSPQAAWQSLEKVNSTPAQPGDQVLFKRGGLWRGTLQPGTGDDEQPLRYADYGDGPLPIFQGSIAADDPALWSEVQPGIWRTALPHWSEEQPFPGNIENIEWHRHQEAGAVATTSNSRDENGRVTARIQVSEISKERQPYHLQWWGPACDNFDSALILELRARSKRPLILRSIQIMKDALPWTGYANGICNTELKDEWQNITILFIRTGADFPGNKKIHINLGDFVQAGDDIELQILSAKTARREGGLNLSVDVGNIIFNHGEVCGWKKWAVDQLDKVGDYFYSRDEACVYLRHDSNPAIANRSVELAMARHLISHGNRKNVIFENLALRYGACHGFGGGSSERITIRGCDIYFIGGAHQFTRPSGHPVRFGNGIEFWGDAKDNLVENCRLWEIYDAALTNQGRDDSEINITYRNNVIWNAEFSFEYWNRKLTENIFFINNTCVDSGYGWAHAQRPDPNGAHLMFYSNRAETRNFVVKDNIFVQTTHAGMRMDLDWLDAITMDHNLWHVGD